MGNGRSGRVFRLGVGVGLVLFAGCEDTSTQGAEAEDAVLRTEMRLIQSAAEDYRNRHGECPEAVLDVVLEGLLQDASGLDPWGREFRLECSAESVSVGSAGPDGRWSSADDLQVRSR